MLTPWLPSIRLQPFPPFDGPLLRGTVNVTMPQDKPGVIDGSKPIKRRDSLDAAAMESVTLPDNIGLLGYSTYLFITVKKFIQGYIFF